MHRLCWLLSFHFDPSLSLQFASSPLHCTTTGMDGRETCADEQDATYQCDHLYRDTSHTANLTHHRTSETDIPYKRTQAPTRDDGLSKSTTIWGACKKSSSWRLAAWISAYLPIRPCLGEAKPRIQEGEYQRHSSNCKADPHSCRSVTGIPRLHLYILPLSPYARGLTRRRQITMR